MSIITKLVRLFGYNIVRYSDPASSLKKIISLHPEIKNDKPLIEQSKAFEALKSVGRSTNVSSFSYYKRPERSSPAMEELENIWWNAHSNIIERTWGLSENINSCYRAAYVSKAAAFFKQPGKKAKILDLGCGTGWFGRMIANSEMEYHGMDFSSSQIDIANSKKQTSSNKDHLNYYCLDDFKKIENLDTVTGVIINAFLHHLYWEDLRHLFEELVKILPNGCKFFIMEPVYPGKSEGVIPEQTGNNNFVAAYRSNLNSIKNDIINKGLYDTKTESELIKIGSESTYNGFFFSPKEVPFKLDEFKTFLSKYVSIENTFHCGVLNLETAQFIEKIKSKEIQQYYIDLLFPFVNSLDKFLLSNHYFEANPNDYLFTAFECVLNKKAK